MARQTKNAVQRRWLAASLTTPLSLALVLMLAAVAFKGGIWLHAQWASVSVNADLSSTNSQSSGCTGNVRLDNEGKGVIEIGEGQSIYVLTSRTEDSMLLTALDERASEESRGLRVVTVYLRASLDTMRSRTSPARRGGDRWRALPQTHAAYEALAPTWCKYTVDAEQRAECVAADVALIVQRERRA